jgi:hypothetical protein
VNSRNKMFSPEAMNAAALYVEKDMGARAIAKHLGLPRQTVKDWLRRLGVYQGATVQKRRYTALAAKRKANARGKQWHLNNTLLLQVWKSEWAGAAHGDERRHWHNHPEAKRWYGAFNARRQYGKAKRTKSNYHISKLIRSRVHRVMRGMLKSAPTLSLLGCGLDQFRAHIQGTFKRGMNWNNHGSVWHVDHIQPCAKFDLSKPEEQRRCFHYSNMRALEAGKNISKRAKIEPCQPELIINLWAQE